MWAGLTKMTVYVIKRMLSVIPVLIGISIIAFALGLMTPGDPAELALSQDGVSEVTAELLQQKRQELGLDRPPAVQYLGWAGKALRGDLGRSYATNRPVRDELLRRLPVTLKLTLYAGVLACVTGILGGTVSAMFYKKPWDRVIVQCSNLVLSFPSFWLGILLIIVFAENWRLLPTSGNGGLRHMILPSVTLAAATSATAIRLMRASMIEQLGKQYMTAAAAKGLGRMNLYVVNALPNAVIPVVSLLCTYIGGILGGSVVVENIFALPGIGSYALTAIKARDYPAIQGYVLVSGFVFVLASLAGDLICSFLDPRIRLEDRKK